MKKILFLSVFMMLAACQNTPVSTQQNLAKSHTGSTEVAPCSNGFDDVNVCQLKS